MALAFLWAARAILITAALGVMLGLALSRAVDRLERLGIRRGFAATLIVLVVFGLLAGAGALAAPKLRDQFVEMQQKLPKVIDAIENWLGQHPEVAQAVGADVGTGGMAVAPARTISPPSTRQPPAPSAASRSEETGRKKQDEPESREATHSLRDRVTGQMGGVLGRLFPFVSNVFTALAGFLLVVFTAIFVATEPDLYRRGMMHLLPKRARGRGAEVLDAIGKVLREWLVARLIAMVVIGLITFGVLLALRVPAAAILGLIAGLLEFIPFFGPIASAVPALGMALLKSPQTMFYVAIAMLAIQQIEGMVVTPLILKDRVDVPPALTIVGVAAMGVIFGILGMLIAEPLLAATLVAVKLLYVSDTLGDHKVEEKGGVS